MAKVKLPPARTKAGQATVSKNGNGNGAPKHDYAVRDLSLAEWGRKTIEVSEHEMPGLMAIRKKYGPHCARNASGKMSNAPFFGRASFPRPIRSGPSAAFLNAPKNPPESAGLAVSLW